MKHITWLLVIVTLALGCGRDKKAWARKISNLVDRAYACEDVACAKQVEKEMGAIIDSDEEGRNLDEGEPEFMLSSAKRIRNRVAELEDAAMEARLAQSSPLSALDVFETTIRACTLAYSDLRSPIRAEVERVLVKVGATLPPDRVAKASSPGGMFWHDEFIDRFNAAMDGKVPFASSVYARAAGNLCVVNYRYESANAKKPDYYGPTIDQLEKIMKLHGKDALVKDLVAAVRRAAPDAEVFALTKTSVTAIRASLGAK